ncbi:hypothetical protein DSC45_28075 [Streptomyces sp. YIM 130001]|uniref:hypothetical protein n=1 Tax=Streptomyces sp. YIM 130001 TaxID=2259644 RepID=UPI000E64E0BB|nr:hypothetical protein [Streptomyces sp. YIM 130001]RII11773.1 hypothetical protein DSC45_28075 [Streptomyces sp. YIM 130001]
MPQETDPRGLSEDIARAVADVPGVAFLKPDLAGRLRTALARPPATAQGAPAGVRLTRPADDFGAWHIEIHLVARARTRTVDVARATRTAVADHLRSVAPAQAGQARITVTVTGLV